MAATGTEGLGLPTTVFDFTGIAKEGADIDERRLLRDERFKKNNAHLYETPDDTGIRDVDKPYIDDMVEKTMEMNAKASRTKKYEDIQAAKNQQAVTAKRIAESRASRERYTKRTDEIRETEEYARNSEMYKRFDETWMQETAMSHENNGEIGEALVYREPVFYEQPKENLMYWVERNASDIIRGAVESEGIKVSREDGTGYGEQWRGLNRETQMKFINASYESGMKTTNFRKAIEYNVMAQMYGTVDLTAPQVNAFNETRDAATQFRAEMNARGVKYEDLASLPEYEGNPTALRQAQELFTFNETVDAMGRQVYAEQMFINTEVGEQTSKTIDQTPAGGAGGGDEPDYAVDHARGMNLKSLIGVSPDTFGGKDAPRVDAAFKANASHNAATGYCSREDSKQALSGSGSLKMVVDGIISQVKYGTDGKPVLDSKGNPVMQRFSVVYKPSENILKKIDAGADVNQYLDQMDAFLVPLDEVQGHIGENELKVMIQKADGQAIYSHNPKTIPQGQYGN